MLRAWVAYFVGALHKLSVQKKVLEILCTFFGEAAVLVAVFPVLETILAGRGVSQAGRATQHGGTQNIWTVAIWSEGIAFLCLLAAIILGIIIANKGD